MKHKFLYFFTAILMAISIYSCKDEDLVGPKDSDREFMTMFRDYKTTGISNDIYSSGIKQGTKNDVYLNWFGIDGAAGYRIKMVIQGTSFDTDCLIDTVVGPDVLSMTIPDLQYEVAFRFAIQTLSKRGEAYNSKWFGYGDGAHPSDYIGYTTLTRGSNIPKVITVGDVTETTMRINFDLTEKVNDVNLEAIDGKFPLDQITVAPSYDNKNLPSQSIKLTPEDIQKGYVDVQGLSPNAVYVVNGLNNRVKRYWDRLYNTVMVRMKGKVGAPITIKYNYDPNDTIQGAHTYKACRIDTVLQNYMSDNSLAEGTVFLLESGKTYYMQNTITMSKGFTLKTTGPEKATVLMGVGKDANGNPYNCNFSFGRNAMNGEMGGINVESIVFDNIKFDAPEAYNFLNKPSTATTGLGNYFINQFSQAMPFILESFETRNCEFQRMIRGWVRFQGNSYRVVRHWITDNCLFYNCGLYDSNGRGYAWIQEDAANDNTTVYNDMNITNCSFIDSPRDNFLSEAKNRSWGADVRWNINVSNNTFFNFSTRSIGRLLFSMRYNPSNSSFTVEKNLFIQHKADGDTRSMSLQGMDIRNFNGVNFYVRNNYSTNTNLNSGSIFSSNGFSSTSQGAGKYNVYGKSETEVKTGVVGISPADMMVSPNSLGKNGEVNMHEYDLNGLYYKNSDAVRNHEIYKLGIGDPRWRKNVTPN